MTCFAPLTDLGGIVRQLALRNSVLEAP